MLKIYNSAETTKVDQRKTVAFFRRNAFGRRYDPTNNFQKDVTGQKINQKNNRIIP